MKKTVSVVMATCNGGRFLKAQVDSILAQTRGPDEMVIVDDRSDDETWSILQSYQSRFPDQVRVFQNSERLGVNKNFEKAAGLATGDLIFFSDQDDIWKQDKIETMVDHLGDASLLHSNGVIVNEKREVLHNNELEFIGVPPVEGVPLVYLVESNSISGHNTLVTRELIKNAIPFADGFVYDKWLGLVACLLNGIRFLDLKLVEHRMHNANAENNPEIRKRKRSSRKKRSKLERFRETSNHRLRLLQRLFQVDTGEFPHKDLLLRYADHLANARWCFLNRSLYQELLQHNYGGCVKLPEDMIKKRLHRMARGELYYRVFRF